MAEVTGPVIGITLVLLAVFLPASFLGGVTGQLYRQFALTIAATALISAINALTLKPAQCARWLRPSKIGSEAPQPPESSGSAPRKLLRLLVFPFRLFIGGFNRAY